MVQFHLEIDGEKRGRNMEAMREGWRGRTMEATREGRFEEVETLLEKPWYSSIPKLAGRREAEIWRPREKAGEAKIRRP